MCWDKLGGDPAKAGGNRIELHLLNYPVTAAVEIVRSKQAQRDGLQIKRVRNYCTVNDLAARTQCTGPEDANELPRTELPLALNGTEEALRTDVTRTKEIQSCEHCKVIHNPGDTVKQNIRSH